MKIQFSVLFFNFSYSNFVYVLVIAILLAALYPHVFIRNTMSIGSNGVSIDYSTVSLLTVALPTNCNAATTYIYSPQCCVY